MPGFLLVPACPAILQGNPPRARTQINNREAATKFVTAGGKVGMSAVV
jgi:hypothetical protein